MKVFIFRTEQALVEFLESRQEIPAILDLSFSQRIRELYPDSILNPSPFSLEQKEKILEEYIEIISELGRLNGFSIPWLCHPISEKNDLLPDNLFKRLTDFLLFRHVYSSIKKQHLVVLATEAVIIRDIKDFLIEENVEVRILPSDPEKGRQLSSMRNWIRRFFSTMKSFLNIQAQNFHSRHLEKNLDHARFYTVIRTWFDARSPSLIERMEDVYFGKLPRFLQSKGHHILYFGDFIEGFSYVAKSLMENRKSPLLLQSAYIHGVDFVKAEFFKRSLDQKIRLKSDLRIMGYRVDRVIENYVKDHNKNPHIRTNFLTYTAVKKMLKTLKVERIYMPFENYSWEKLTRRAIRDMGADTRVIAFQHSQVALNSTKYFLGRAESQGSYLPDKILTLGSITRDFLVQKNYPEERLKIGCALRHDYSPVVKSAKQGTSNRVLVLLWTFQKSVRMVNFILSNRSILNEYEISICPHPCHPMNNLLPYLDSPLTKDDKVASGPLSEIFNATDAVIYHGTTACLDALAHGRPVINMEFDDFISPDPLFDFHDFKWNARTPEELVTALDEIFSMNVVEYSTKQKAAFDFVGRYFQPVSEKGLTSFIIP